jgi:uncharacterized protein (TIGR00251 family)
VIRVSVVPDGAIVGNASGGCQISCFATPRSSRNALVAWHDGRLKVALAAPPVDGEANKTLVKFMAETLNLPKSSVAIASGASGRRKSVAVKGITPDEVKNILSRLIQE